VNVQTDQANQSSDSIDIARYFALFWKWAWLIIFAGILAGGTGYLVSKRISPVYEASTMVLVDQARSNQASDWSTIQTSQMMVGTYIKMIGTSSIQDEVAKKMNLSANSVGFSVSASQVLDTQMMEITVSSEDPQLAATAANTVVNVFAEKVLTMQEERYAVSKQNLQVQMSEMQKQIQELDTKIQNTQDPTEKDRLQTDTNQYRQIYANLIVSYEEVRLAEAQTISNIIQVEPAKIPASPVSPKVTQNTLLAMVLGMFLAAGVVFASDALDDTFRSADEVSRRLGLPVLAIIPHFLSPDGKPIVESQPRSPFSEAFRNLRTNVQFTSVDNPLKSILVTSAEPSDGKTTVTVNLATVFAQSGVRVTLIDCDMRHPSVHKRLQQPNQVGLSSLFVSQDLNQNGSIQPTRIESLSIISAGEIPPNPSELLGSKKMNLILSWVKESSDLVLLDTPPVMVVTDASVLVPIVDGVLLVVEAGSTRTSSAREMVEQLRRVNANVIGVVFNNLNKRDVRYGNYRNKSFNKYYADDGSTRKIWWDLRKKKA
jgi:capsular exopolysaccharide synthesis family protein